jgi:hypothetical protein
MAALPGAPRGCNYKEFAMSRYDPEYVQAAIARATYERNMVMAEILADGILYVSGGIGKAWRAFVGLFSHKPEGRPAVSA